MEFALPAMILKRRVALKVQRGVEQGEPRHACRRLLALQDAREAAKDGGLQTLCMIPLKGCIKQFTIDSHANATTNRTNMYTMEQEK